MIIDPRISRWPSSTNSLSTAALTRWLAEAGEETERVHRRSLLENRPPQAEALLDAARESRNGR